MMRAHPNDLMTPLNPLGAHATLAEALRALFPADVAVVVTDPTAPHGAPLPDELPAIARAGPKRRIEFAAGRAAIRQAMQALDAAPCAVPAGPDRAPIWPEGIVGSLSHCDTACVAALGRTPRLRAIGIDIEADIGLSPDLIPTICSLAERAWLSTQPEDQRALLAKLIFCAKECAYKCQYPVTQVLFDFDTLEITPDLDTGQFEATFTREIGCFAAGTCLSGRFAVTGGVIACGMVLAASPRWGLIDQQAFGAREGYL
ncbi:4'-phosphopantetheinyl transferase superfamily protein [Rhodobacteraceae bacterium KMM 6894]|nr:4'-phosphopantetheinyl transferase superfamily protein [Rhodobacteraceae bacterium KMM 6894]